MERINWHRMFGLLLTDFFTGSSYVVEMEKDLSRMKQLLDVVVVRKGSKELSEPVPDGMEDMAPHNLITFKSFHEALDDWVFKELTGHFVNYRKQVSDSLDNLLPEEDFRLYAICIRFPQKLAGEVELQRLRPGVYEYRRGTDLIRIIVATELPRTPNNAILHLLCAAQEQVSYGAAHFKQHSANTSTLLGQLFKDYQREGLNMPYTMQDFQREYAKEHLKDLSPDERLAGLSTEEILKRIPPEERLKGLPPEEIERYLQRIKADSSSRKRKKKK